MKKALSSIIAMWLVVFIMISNLSTVFAFSNGKIEIESVTVKPGEQVTVAVNVTNNPGIVSIALQLKYDKSALKLVNIENGSIFKKSSATFGDNYDTIPYKMVWEDGLSQNNIKTGTLVVLTFKVLETTNASVSNITIEPDDDSTFNYNMKNVQFQISQGTIKIEQDTVTEVSFIQTILGYFKKLFVFIKGLFA